MKNHSHCHSAPWKPDTRCTGCGHRIASSGNGPCRTRELPVLLWPFELAARIEARLRRKLKVT